MTAEPDDSEHAPGLTRTVARNCYRPRWWIGSVVPYLLHRAMDRYFAHFPRERCDVMREDWDTLLIADACRYDLFEDEADLPGDLEYRVSRGSDTGEFFEENFRQARHHDTVYVTANPVPRVEKWCSVDVDSVFHDVVDVWEDHWDAELNTVRPERVAAAVEAAHDEYPNKRIVGHFIQPHQPFIGEQGQDIDERGMTAYDELSQREGDARRKVWDQLRDGDISADRVWEAYRENLAVVLPHVRELCETLEGKIVVTSDHGNLLGEVAWPFPVRKYGHPRGVHTKKLVTVPWLEIESGERRTIVSESPVESETATDDEERLERLAALGYR